MLDQHFAGLGVDLPVPELLHEQLLHAGGPQLRPQRPDVALPLFGDDDLMDAIEPEDRFVPGGRHVLRRDLLGPLFRHLPGQLQGGIYCHVLPPEPHDFGVVHPHADIGQRRHSDSLRRPPQVHHPGAVLCDRVVDAYRHLAARRRQFRKMPAAELLGNLDRALLGDHLHRHRRLRLGTDEADDLLRLVVEDGVAVGVLTRRGYGVERDVGVGPGAGRESDLAGRRSQLDRNAGRVGEELLHCRSVRLHLGCSRWRRHTRAMHEREGEQRGRRADHINTTPPTNERHTVGAGSVWSPDGRDCWAVE